MLTNDHWNRLQIIIIIISGFGIYGAAVVPDSGVGNTWQRLTLVLHEFLSNGLTPSRLHIHSHIISHTCGPRLPWPPTISGAWNPQSRDGVDARSGTLYVPVPPKTPSAKNSRDLVYIQPPTPKRGEDTCGTRVRPHAKFGVNWPAGCREIVDKKRTKPQK